MWKSVPEVLGWRLCVWTLGVATVACATGRRAPPFTIRVVPDTVMLVEKPVGAGFHASALIRNDAARPLHERSSLPFVVRGETAP